MGSPVPVHAGLKILVVISYRPLYNRETQMASSKSLFLKQCLLTI